MKGLRTGAYADGAMIAEEMLELKVGEKGSGGEGNRVLTGVLIKDSQRYAATGGWGFGNFFEGSKANTLDAKAHRGYVFAEYAER